MEIIWPPRNSRKFRWRKAARARGSRQALPGVTALPPFIKSSILAYPYAADDRDARKAAGSLPRRADLQRGGEPARAARPDRRDARAARAELGAPPRRRRQP